MNPLEDRLRTSLRAQADEVEPAQQLWRETNRRIDRRARRRTLGWSLAGVATAAAAVLAVVAVTGLAPELPVPEVAGVPDGQDPADATDPGVDEGADPAGRDGDGASAPSGPQLTASAASIELRDPDGGIVDQLVLPSEGESGILSLAVRPGSTPDALTVAVFTQAEGMVDLRVARRDADGFAMTSVEATYQPSAGVSPAAISGPAFSPDGTSLAWLESGPAPTLRTIGWDDDGAGTGAPATDNAAFTLDEELATRHLHDWVVAAGPDGSVLRVSDAASTSWFAIPLVRQADGSWAREPGAGMEPIPAPDDLGAPGRTARLTNGALSVPVR